MKTASAASEAVRVLSENEIQDRLYGDYRGRRVSPPLSVSASPVVSGQDHPTFPSSASVWTGSEILSGEVKRLRAELISLRQEKERLATQLNRLEIQKPSSGIRVPSAQAVPSRWISRFLGMILLAGALAALVHFNGTVLQASPMGEAATPFTIQVAVYDIKGMAEKAQGMLRDLGYDAFLVGLPRRDGLARYRVYVGSFVTKEEARLESERLAGDPRFQDFKDAFVRFR